MILSAAPGNRREFCAIGAFGGRMRAWLAPACPSRPLFARSSRAAVSAQSPKTHRLEATPSTVAYGHYWAETKPVLTIDSGDIIDVDTLLTNTPDRLEKSGVPAAEIQASLRAIVDQVKDRGPGGHILTGPVYVNGAEPGDALEVKVLSIDLPIAYGYNGCSGYVRENCEPGRPQTIIRLDRKNMTATFLPGIVIPLRPFFGSMGVAPAARSGPRQQQPAEHACRQSRQQGAGRRHDAVHSGAREGRALRSRRRPCGAGRRRSRSDRRSKPRCADSCS